MHQIVLGVGIPLERQKVMLLVLHSLPSRIDIEESSPYLQSYSIFGFPHGPSQSFASSLLRRRPREVHGSHVELLWLAVTTFFIQYCHFRGKENGELFCFRVKKHPRKRPCLPLNRKPLFQLVLICYVSTTKLNTATK